MKEPGTVEFLADDAEGFFFLEMNTRLQVEHPVTECITGLDLVRLQIQVADGQPLPAEQPTVRGHSIEVRLYAEDPAAGWQPQSGTVHRFRLPGVAAEFATPNGYGLRLDSGIVDGSQVSVFYDCLLAKVISWAPRRTEAARMLASGMARSHLHGVRTNRDLLVRVLQHPAFLAGDTDTAFFDKHGMACLSEPLADKDTVWLSALAAALAEAANNRATATTLAAVPSGWRNVASQLQRRTFLSAGEEIRVEYRLSRSALIAPAYPDVQFISAEAGRVVVEVAGVRRSFDVARYADLICVDSTLGSVSFTPVHRFPDQSAQAAPGSLLAPMPGSVVRIAAGVGDRVVRGQPLLWLEAMKMQHTIAAPTTGVVTELPVAVGQQVEVGSVLAVLDAEES